MGKGKGQEKGRNLLWNDYLLVLEKEAASMRGGYSQPGAPRGQVTAWRIWRELPEAWVGLLHPAWTPGPLGALHLTCSSRVWAVGLQSPRVPDWAPRVPPTHPSLFFTFSLKKVLYDCTPTIRRHDICGGCMLVCVSVSIHVWALRFMQ